MNQRDNSIDIAKTIGIILVVLGHTDFPYSQLVYQFHLPLFFFLSGAVFDEKKMENMKQFVFKKFKGLYWPFVKFELLFLFLHNAFSEIGFYSNASGIKEYYNSKDFGIMILKILTMGGGEQLAGPLWFLISSLEIVLIFALLLKIFKSVKKYADGFLLLFCLLLYYIGCYTNLPRMLSQSLIGLLFFCCGYVYRKNKEKIALNGLALLIAAIVVLVCYKFNYVDISRLEITHKWMLIVSGLAGTYCVLFAAKKLEKTRNSFWVYCGKNSIYILLLHCVSFKIIMAVEIAFNHVNWDYLGTFPVYKINEWWCIPLTLAGVFIPLMVKRIIEQSFLIKRKMSC